MSTDLVPWKAPEPPKLPADAKSPDTFVKYALALRPADQARVIQAISSGFHDLATEFVWKRSLARLRSVLATLGMQFIGEMLDRDDIDELSSPDAVLTDWDAIRLAENLGVITTTGALRLRHAFELLAHLAETTEDEQLDENEAIATIKACVQYVLSEKDIGVAVDFANLRDRLLSEGLSKDDPQVESLVRSTSFFLRTALRVMLAAIKNDTGVRFEHATSNLNMILPLVWKRLAENDRWSVGRAYTDVANAGKSLAISGLRQALLKVKGFDYVPENVRSNVFIHAAKALLNAHFSRDNFAGEVEPAKQLATLGTTIPKSALIECMQAYLCVYLGNKYNISFAAAPIAGDQLKKLSSDQWRYYLSRVLVSDDYVLSTLTDSKPASRFCDLAAELSFDGQGIEDKQLQLLIAAARDRKPLAVEKIATKLWLRTRGSQ